MTRKRPQSTRQPAPDRLRAADVPATDLSRSSGSSHAPASVPHANLAAAPALNLDAPFTGGLQDVILDLAGAERVTLRQTLTLWQREQDRILNRAWRRPGGLARPAGL